MTHQARKQGGRSLLLPELPVRPRNLQEDWDKSKGINKMSDRGGQSQQAASPARFRHQMISVNGCQSEYHRLLLTYILPGGSHFQLFSITVGREPSAKS